MMAKVAVTGVTLITLMASACAGGEPANPTAGAWVRLPRGPVPQDPSDAGADARTGSTSDAEAEVTEFYIYVPTEAGLDGGAE